MLFCWEPDSQPGSSGFHSYKTRTHFLAFSKSFSSREYLSREATDVIDPTTNFHIIKESEPEASGLIIGHSQDILALRVLVRADALFRYLLSPFLRARERESEDAVLSRNKSFGPRTKRRCHRKLLHIPARIRDQCFKPTIFTGRTTRDPLCRCHRQQLPIFFDKVHTLKQKKSKESC